MKTPQSEGIFGPAIGPTLKTALCHIRALVGRMINNQNCMKMSCNIVDDIYLKKSPLCFVLRLLKHKDPCCRLLAVSGKHFKLMSLILTRDPSHLTLCPATLSLVKTKTYTVLLKNAKLEDQRREFDPLEIALFLVKGM